MYMYIHFSLLQEGRSSECLAYFGRHHYSKDTRKAVFELNERVVLANAEENNFVIHLI